MLPPALSPSPPSQLRPKGRRRKEETSQVDVIVAHGTGEGEEEREKAGVNNGKTAHRRRRRFTTSLHPGVSGGSSTGRNRRHPHFLLDNDRRGPRGEELQLLPIKLQKEKKRNLHFTASVSFYFYYYFFKERDRDRFI